MRKFLVILDDTRECLNAMRYAAMRAAKTGGGVEILSIIPPDEFNHWLKTIPKWAFSSWVRAVAKKAPARLSRS